MLPVSSQLPVETPLHWTQIVKGYLTSRECIQASLCNRDFHKAFRKSVFERTLTVLHRKIEEYLTPTACIQLSLCSRHFQKTFQKIDWKFFAQRDAVGSYQRFNKEIRGYFPTPNTQNPAWKSLVKMQGLGQEPWCGRSLQNMVYSHVECLAICPDPLSPTIAIALNNRSICFFFDKGKSAFTYQPLHTGTISCMAFLRDGSLATGSHDCTLKISCLKKVYGSSVYELLHICQEHQRAITSLSVCYSTNTILTASTDRTVRHWAANGACLEGFVLDRDISGLTTISQNTFAYFEPDSFNWLQVNRKTARARCIQGHKNRITCLSVLSENEILTGSSDKTFCLWSDRSFKKSFPAQSTIQFIVALSHRRAFAITEDNLITLWNLKNDKKIAEWQLKSSYPVVAAQALGKEELVTVTKIGELQVWSPNLSQFVQRVDVLKGVKLNLWTMKK